MSIDKIKIASIKAISSILEGALEDNMNVRFIVTGISMYPLFRGDVDTVTLKKKTTVKKYDILLYQRENGDYILHRVVNIKNDILYMAGDYETTIEFPIYKNQVIATVESFSRKNKNISCRNLFYKLYSFIWVLVIPRRHQIINLLKRMQFAVVRIRRWKCL